MHFRCSLTFLFVCLAVSFTTKACSERQIAVNSSKDLYDVSIGQDLNCLVISILPHTILLSGSITFSNANNISIIGSSSQQTNITCRPHSGLQFVKSSFIRLENLAFYNCTSNITVQAPSYQIVHQAAVYIRQCSDVRIVNCSFAFSPGTGLILYEVFSNNSIEDSKFTDNKFQEDSNYITFSTNLTYGGMIVHRDSGLDNATYAINKCSFHGNINSKTHGIGGGLSLLFQSNGSNNVFISRCDFEVNEAKAGGGMIINQTGHSSNSVSISRTTTFLGNFAHSQGGGIWVINEGPRNTTLFLTIRGSHFELNYALWGGGVASYASRKWGTVNITVFSTTFTSNAAGTSGFALGMSEDVRFDVETGAKLFGIDATLEDCYIHNNSLVGSVVNNRGVVGAIYARASKVTLRGQTQLKENYGSAVYLIKSAHLYFKEGDIMFSENRATQGGGIHLTDSSVIHLAPQNTRLSFIQNSAIVKGGAIYAEVSNGDPCIFSFLNSTNAFLQYTTSSVWFFDNRADNFLLDQNVYVSGDSYDTQNCTSKNKNLLLNSPFFYDPEVSTSVLFDAESVKLDCSPPLNCSNGSLSIMLGEMFHLSPTIRDKFGHETVAFAYLSLKQNSSSSSSKFTFVGPKSIGLDRFTKNNRLCITGKGNDTNHSTLTLELFYVKNEGGYRDGYKSLTVEVNPCRLGFFYNNESEKCDCVESTYSDNNIILCPDTRSACVLYGYWFGMANGKLTYNVCERDQCNYTHHQCPRATCPESPNYCLLTESSDDLCLEGRGGILCSHCKEGYAFTFNSLKCVSNKTCSIPNTVLISLGVLSYWLGMTLLFFFVLSTNLSVGTGFASGIIYYFSVVFILTDSVTFSSWFVTIFLTVPIAITQLCAKVFGNILVCFIEGLDKNLPHYMFHYVSPIFVIVMILSIIFFSRHCKCPKWLSLAENSPNHAICLLILISYTSVTYTSFQILRPIRINGKAYVYIDPDIEYFRGQHIPYALFAILVEVVSFSISILLLLAPFLSKIKRVNLVRLRIKPILDEFQACYKDKHRWFAGFYFLTRQLMYLANSFLLEVLPQSNSLIHCVTVSTLLIVTLVQPYKPQFWYLNTIDTLLLTDLLLLSILPGVVSQSNNAGLPAFIVKFQVIAPYVLILLPSLYLFGIIVFLLLKRCQRWWMKVKSKRKEGFSSEITDASKEDDANFKYLQKGDKIDPFYRDCGEREPLLSDLAPDYDTTYSSFESKKKHSTTPRKERVTSSSLRVSNLRPFPPSPVNDWEQHKAVTA